MTKCLRFAKNAQASVLQRMPKRKADETPETAHAFPPRRVRPRVTIWFVTEELVDNTWKVICHYRDYMEAHNAMRNFERQNFGIIRVSHVWEYEALLSGKYHRVFTRDPLQPDVIRVLNAGSLSVRALEILKAVEILPVQANDA